MSAVCGPSSLLTFVYLNNINCFIVNLPRSEVHHHKTQTMAGKIYTKTGDKGTTSLIGGTKVSKSHLRIEAYGTVDELNSYIGLCRDMVNDEQTRTILLETQ